MRVLKPVCEEDAAAEENVRLTRSESLSRLMASESSRRGHRRSRRLMESESRGEVSESSRRHERKREDALVERERGEIMTRVHKTSSLVWLN